MAWFLHAYCLLYSCSLAAGAAAALLAVVCTLPSYADVYASEHLGLAAHRSFTKRREREKKLPIWHQNSKSA